MSFLQGSLAALTGVAVAACVTVAPPPLAKGATRVSAPLSCRVDAVARAGRTEVRASVTATAPVSGLFWLDLSRSGAGGSDTIVQSGPFSAAPGETLTLGAAGFGGAPSVLRARMVLTWAGGEVRCAVAPPMVPL